MNQVLTKGFILIVDDNPTNLSVLSEALAGEGWRFRVAVDGESAIAQAERNQPELILLDVQMPGIDGFETCRRLKANPVTQNIPVIFTTALADTESKIHGFSLGAVDYIPKPFAQAEVIARVRVHLQLQQLTQSLEEQVRDRTTALQKAQVQLVQQEKLSTLGELIAGIAHEMNNPIGFIVNNIPPLQEYIADITKLLQLYEQEYPVPSATITTFIHNLDLPFVLEDLEKIVSSIEVGSERIQHLSTSLRSFSRSDSDTKLPADLHTGMDSTLLILQHRLKPNGDRPAIEVIRAYGKLPHVPCYIGEMNQVFMNLLANAVDALDEAIIQGKMSDRIPQIQITTDVNSQQMAVIKIADNGIGIPERLKQRLFEPLFTTKPVGKGTGLGLSIAHQIIVEKHNGTMEVNSQPGIGTEFTIAIPIS
ncbi:hybrid sensor histidine kinase/response regulator [Nostoc sp. FACHB-87]|uniref:sensor histidine kinase n=1 Tax=Nostocaceae TaxID=1162 RepID=UPI0016884B01|nr:MULTISPECIES: hybrid sensor histidine kinase/response regulator [Nostocaceae]MBD2456461.1 hybrid sensor histidine kinase/response regulator [Nostoc sp. FACHB-87]MBD2473995.1 hybrid sensor histidine kinase/response regulator [Anabaena sp. FACHB-83]